MIDTTNIQNRLRTELVLRYGLDTMRPHSRAMYFGEEAIEVLRSLGLTVYEVVNLVNFVFDESRDDGDLPQELAHAGLGLISLAGSVNQSLSVEMERELKRIEDTPVAVSGAEHWLKSGLGVDDPPAEFAC